MLSPIRTVVCRLLNFIFFVTLLALLPLSAANRPNVLFLSVDDLKPDLGCYGNTVVKTPQIDRLAGMGTVMVNNYCQQAVCATSRNSKVPKTAAAAAIAQAAGMR